MPSGSDDDDDAPEEYWRLIDKMHGRDGANMGGQRAKDTKTARAKSASTVRCNIVELHSVRVPKSRGRGSKRGICYSLMERIEE